MVGRNENRSVRADHSGQRDLHPVLHHAQRRKGARRSARRRVGGVTCRAARRSAHRIRRLTDCSRPGRRILRVRRPYRHEWWPSSHFVQGDTARSCAASACHERRDQISRSRDVARKGNDRPRDPRARVSSLRVARQAGSGRALVRCGCGNCHHRARSLELLLEHLTTVRPGVLLLPACRAADGERGRAPDHLGARAHGRVRRDPRAL